MTGRSFVRSSFVRSPVVVKGPDCSISPVWPFFTLVLPKLRKSPFSQRRVSRCALQVAMPEIVRQRPIDLDE